MKNLLKKIPVLIYLMLIFSINSIGQLTKYDTNKPEEAVFVYTDVENFIKAFGMLKPGVDSLQIIQNEYIDKGTDGLKEFNSKYGLSSKAILKAVRRHREDYIALEKRLNWLKTQEDTLRLAYKKLKYFIPNAFFPPTYYIVGKYWGYNSGSKAGILLTVERRASKNIKSSKKVTMVHEMVHMQQAMAIGYPDKYLAIYKDEKSLLALTIREGIAEFFADMVTGKYSQERARKFVVENEKEIWEKFKKEMYGKETGEWMWKKPSNKEQPRDVAYVLGAKIVEHYYKQSLDINKAINEILSVTDYKSFIEKSIYADKFKELH